MNGWWLMGRSKVWLVLVGLLGCVKPGPALEPDAGSTPSAPRGHVLLTPTRLVLPTTVVGSQSSVDFQVVNDGDAGLSLSLVRVPRDRDHRFHGKLIGHSTRS